MQSEGGFCHKKQRHPKEAGPTQTNSNTFLGLGVWGHLDATHLLRGAERGYLVEILAWEHGEQNVACFLNSSLEAMCGL